MKIVSKLTILECEDRKKYQLDDSDDDWGVEEKVVPAKEEKREKSTVSTTFTQNSNKNYHRQEQKETEWVASKHNDSKIEIDDFDNHSFASSRR